MSYTILSIIGGLIFAVAAIFFGKIMTTVHPNVQRKNSVLIASTPWQWQLATLGASNRELRIDPRTKLVYFFTRSFWFSKHKQHFAFDQVAHVYYRYVDMSPPAYMPIAYREADIFQVGFMMKNGREIKLFTFMGRGSFVNNTRMPDWLYWEDFAIARLTAGNQETESLAFANTISLLVGVGLQR